MSAPKIAQTAPYAVDVQRMARTNHRDQDFGQCVQILRQVRAVKIWSARSASAHEQEWDCSLCHYSNSIR